MRHELERDVEDGESDRLEAWTIDKDAEVRDLTMSSFMFEACKNKADIEETRGDNRYKHLTIGSR